MATKKDVKQIGTFKMFCHQLDVKFHNIDINVLCNRILIILAIVWLFVLTLYVGVRDIQLNTPRPVTDLELLEILED